jgi:hypothetical protein
LRHGGGSLVLSQGHDGSRRRCVAFLRFSCGLDRVFVQVRARPLLDTWTSWSRTRRPNFSGWGQTLNLATI